MMAHNMIAFDCYVHPISVYHTRMHTTQFNASALLLLHAGALALQRLPVGILLAALSRNAQFPAVCLCMQISVCPRAAMRKELFSGMIAPLRSMLNEGTLLAEKVKALELKSTLSESAWTGTRTITKTQSSD